MNEELSDWRQTIDALDHALILLLAERFRVTHKVGVYKSTHALPPVDPAREAAQRERAERLAAEAGLDPVFALKMQRLIIDEVVRRHRQLADASPRQ